MKTLNLVGLGNDVLNKRSYFILKLDESFYGVFNAILDKINLKDRIYKEQLPLSKRKNEIDHFKNDKFDIDVVYTDNRIIIIVRADQSNLEKFKSLILAYSKMEE